MRLPTIQGVMRRRILRLPDAIVGGLVHQEYWIPAEELPEFNQNIIGRIEVLAEYRDEEGD